MLAQAVMDVPDVMTVMVMTTWMVVETTLRQFPLMKLQWVMTLVMTASEGLRVLLPALWELADEVLGDRAVHCPRK